MDLYRQRLQSDKRSLIRPSLVTLAIYGKDLIESVSGDVLPTQAIEPKVRPLIPCMNEKKNQLLQICTARTTFSDSVIRSTLVRFGNYPLAQQSCGEDIGSVPYVCI